MQTIIYRLEAKGAVERVKKIGNAHVFAPAVSHKSTVGALVEELIRRLGGTAEPVMAHLVESGQDRAQGSAGTGSAAPKVEERRARNDGAPGDEIPFPRFWLHAVAASSLAGHALWAGRRPGFILPCRGAPARLRYFAGGWPCFRFILPANLLAPLVGFLPWISHGGSWMPARVR